MSPTCSLDLILNETCTNIRNTTTCLKKKLNCFCQQQLPLAGIFAHSVRKTTKMNHIIRSQAALETARQTHLQSWVSTDWQTQSAAPRQRRAEPVWRESRTQNCVFYLPTRCRSGCKQNQQLQESSSVTVTLLQQKHPGLWAPQGSYNHTFGGCSVYLCRISMNSLKHYPVVFYCSAEHSSVIMETFKTAAPLKIKRNNTGLSSSIQSSNTTVSREKTKAVGSVWVITPCGAASRLFLLLWGLVVAASGRKEKKKSISHSERGKREITQLWKSLFVRHRF